nr:MAG TPA: hypothetical protein [Caudoviricetes sp.]
MLILLRPHLPKQYWYTFKHKEVSVKHKRTTLAAGNKCS